MNSPDSTAGHAGSTWRREKIRLSLMLAVTAGFVDAAGFLLLSHLFTAHMSGNSAAMGAYLGRGDWHEALHRAFPIPCFIVGVAGGAALTEIAARRSFRAPFVPALAVETVFLGAFLLFGGGLTVVNSLRANAAWQFYALAALPAVAMGIQSATLRRVGNLPIRTTYVTGMLTDFAEAAVDYLFQFQPRRAAGERVMLYGGLWCAFAAGALGGGYAETRWGINALIMPLGALVLVMAQDWIAPVAIRSQQREK